MPETGRKFAFDDVDAKVGNVFSNEREKGRALFRAAKGLSEKSPESVSGRRLSSLGCNEELHPRRIVRLE